MTKWIPAFLISVSYAFSALAYFRLPEQVSPQWTALAPWITSATAEAVPRAFAVFALPTVAFAVWLLLRAVASAAGERLGRRIFPGWLVSERTGSAAVERFGPTFDVIVAVVVALVLLFHTVTLGTVLDWPRWTLQAFTALVGVGIGLLGNIMPRTRPNWVAGLRTRRTLSDPDLWRRTHRYFGALLIITGMAVVAASVLAAPYALVVGLAGTLLSAVTATVFAQGKDGVGRTGRPLALMVLIVCGRGLSGGVELAAQDLSPIPGLEPRIVDQPFDVTRGGLRLPGTLTLPSQVNGPIPEKVIGNGASTAGLVQIRYLRLVQ